MRLAMGDHRAVVASVFDTGERCDADDCLGKEACRVLFADAAPPHEPAVEPYQLGVLVGVVVALAERVVPRPEAGRAEQPGEHRAPRQAAGEDDYVVRSCPGHTGLRTGRCRPRRDTLRTEPR